MLFILKSNIAICFLNDRFIGIIIIIINFYTALFFTKLQSA